MSRRRNGNGNGNGNSDGDSEEDGGGNDERSADEPWAAADGLRAAAELREGDGGSLQGDHDGAGRLVLPAAGPHRPDELLPERLQRKFETVLFARAVSNGLHLCVSVIECRGDCPGDSCEVLSDVRTYLLIWMECVSAYVMITYGE